MTDKKRSFVMYNDYLEYFGMLEAAEQGQLIMLILRYVNNEPTDTEGISGMVRMAFAFIRRRLDEDAEKYEQACRNKSEAAKKREDAKRNSKQTSTKTTSKTHLTTKNTAVGDNDNVSDNENDSVNVNVVVSGCDNVVSDRDNRSAQTTDRTTTTTTTEKNNSPVSSFVPPSFGEVFDYCKQENIHIDAKKFIDYYNANGWRVGRNPMSDWQAAVRVWQRNERSDKYHSSDNSYNSYNDCSGSYPEPPSCQSRPAYDVYADELESYEIYNDL